ncbi:hypothetical protein ILUMI_03394 [Ignelater luminosus]|uniref:Peptidase aspartic putative domain-containing protein n=1 Tax=Ignelater luminosus TaxID=2038154 RepID=A0A8K0DFW4_IGNLU|nr:hypothetical protein ILUMI_03394 [Ignelater luminosus]
MEALKKETQECQEFGRATLPGSRARQVVESFPAMQENYENIIDSLKPTFGRQDLQIEVYVRELLKLILDNAISSGKIDTSTLYDKIECQVRTLETLGVTKKNPIELSIGAGFAGKLYTRRRHILKNRLVAVKTTLGWTLMGQVPTSKPDTSTTITVLSLLVKDALIANLWELDLLGITELNNQKISLHEADRDFLRFLRVNADGDEIIYRYNRVVFGVNCCLFLLGAKFEYHLSQGLKQCETEDVNCSVETVSQLQKSFYVDNCVTSVSSEVVLKRGWEFTDISKKDKESSVFVLVVVESNIENVESFEECVTERVILSTAQRIFDPIGFTCPTILIPKLLLQRIWQQQLSWDMPNDEEIKSLFLKWLRQVNREPHETVEYDEVKINKEKRKRPITTLMDLSSDYWHLTYFSNYMRIVPMVAWIFRFVNNWRQKNISGVLTFKKIEIKAEIFVLKVEQNQSFDRENDERLSTLRPFIHKNGLIRLKTRVSNREDIKDFCFPVVLPAKHPLVLRLIFSLHERLYYVGTEELLSKLREGTALTKVRQKARCNEVPTHSGGECDLKVCPAMDTKVIHSIDIDTDDQPNQWPKESESTEVIDGGKNECVIEVKATRSGRVPRLPQRYF